jgi:hypothetical protein
VPASRGGGLNQSASEIPSKFFAKVLHSLTRKISAKEKLFEYSRLTSGAEMWHIACGTQLQGMRHAFLKRRKSYDQEMVLCGGGFIDRGPVDCGM